MKSLVFATLMVASPALAQAPSPPSQPADHHISVKFEDIK
jgi:hypothetical protein